jgi:hypothetical protein
MPETPNDETIIVYAKIPPVETWGRMVEYRLIDATAASGKRLGPVLQEAYRCRENGKIKWETVPTTELTVADFLAETS